MRHIKFKDEVVEAYTETDLARELHSESNLTHTESKIIVSKIFELMEQAILKHDAVLIRKLFKIHRYVKQGPVWFHPPEHFEMLKKGEIESLKELTCSKKMSKPYYRVNISLATEFRKKMREKSREDLPEDYFESRNT